MNTANLQLEGLYLSIAAMNEAIVRKGVLTREQVDAALRSAEETAASDYGNEDKSSANRDAVANDLSGPVSHRRLAGETLCSLRLRCIRLEALDGSGEFPRMER